MTDKSEVGVLLLSHWSSKPGEMDVVLATTEICEEGAYFTQKDIERTTYSYSLMFIINAAFLP